MKNQEAMRCLLCKNARCQAGCPVHTDIPTSQKLYREGSLEEAATLLFAHNPMTAVTCQVCDWKKYCYGHCVLNAKKEPIRWYEIEQEISMPYLLTLNLEKPVSNGHKVAIVGAGPAGISASILLAREGYAVTLLDGHAEVGGVLRYGIPAFRLEKTYLDAYARILNQLGVTFQGNTVVGNDCTVAQLQQEYEAVLVCSGAVKQHRLRIPGEEMDHVIEALDYLEKPEAYQLGKKVIVIGGGNVAMDACRTAVRQGSDTAVYYRKTFENMPANPIEVEEAKADGVTFEVFKAPIEVKPHSVIFRDCENYVNEAGKTMTRILEGTDQEVECDDLLVAAGETIDLSIFGDTMPALNDWHFPLVNEKNETSLSRVFVAGDLLLGARTVVEAVASARLAVEGIRECLEGDNHE